MTKMHAAMILRQLEETHQGHSLIAVAVPISGSRRVHEAPDT